MHAKGRSMVNFYFVNALGQNLENSESCLCLRLLKAAKIQNKIRKGHGSNSPIEGYPWGLPKMRFRLFPPYLKSSLQW